MSNIVISLHRTGSTWISHYAAAHFKNPPRPTDPFFFKKAKELVGNQNPWTQEWLSMLCDVYGVDVALLIVENYNEKHFLKIHTSQIYRHNIDDWFRDFYKNYNKIKVINKNAWRMFTSKIFAFNKVEKNIKNLKLFLDVFVKDYTFYINYDFYDYTINYNEIDHDWLNAHFKCHLEYKKNVKKDYEKLLQDRGINYVQLKRELYESLKSNGLQLSDYTISK